MGEKWLDIHLEGKGKTRKQLAARLFEQNLTAVAEVGSLYYSLRHSLIVF
jgi:tRNA splicing ligase